jgi:hypothetical protein
MATTNEQFAKTGLPCIVSLSMERDCARLLLDIFYTSNDRLWLRITGVVTHLSEAEVEIAF